MSRRCPEDVPEDSRMSPTCGLFQILKILVFFLFFPRFWSNCFVFVFCVVFLGGFVRLALKKLVEFNSVCKIPFVLFAVQSVPNIFCFTIVLRCFACLCFSLPPWEGRGLELPGFQIYVQKLFSQTHVEAKHVFANLHRQTS